MNDLAFAAEITDTLAHGQEGARRRRDVAVHAGVPGAQTLVHEVVGFRVLPAKQPSLPDGHPAGIITALRCTVAPAVNP